MLTCRSDEKVGKRHTASGNPEAWSGVAYAEFRSDELSTCYEATQFPSRVEAYPSHA